MARYWIRNRGRVQGPFSEERIQGLMRRGRFSRHFHVSEDRKNWYPASDYPEFFRGAGGSEPDEDDGPFQSGGSPFDDDDDDEFDDDPPERTRTKNSKRPSKRRAPVAEDDDDEDEDEDDAWDDDDEEWEDDDSGGVLTGLVDWIEANVKMLAAVLIVVLGVLVWFTFGGEDFTQDTADLQTLQGFQSQIVRAHQSGASADKWIPMVESIQADLAPMVSRLEDNASAVDHVKQTLLFIARDDLPRMLKELQVNKQDAAQRVMQQLDIVDTMIKQQTRFNEADSMMTPQQIPKMNQQPAGNLPSGSTNPGNGQPLTPEQPGEGTPANGPTNPNAGSGRPQNGNFPPQ